jgi:CheY-like chemotaxis protein
VPFNPITQFNETLINNWFLAVDLLAMKGSFGAGRSCFLPRNNMQGTPPMKDFGNQQPLVLVIDDDRDILDKVTSALSQANISCRCCMTSEEALAAAQDCPPDLVLCDVSLQGESGFDLYERIRQQPGLEQTPVMFLSGAQLPDIIRRRYSDGGTYCIRKPFDPAVLVELIDQALAVPEA